MVLKYKDFLKINEADYLKVLTTDAEDVKIAKQSFEDLKKELDEYKSKKSSLETLYKNMNLSSEEVGESAKKIIIKDNKTNSFLSNYSNILSLGRQIVTKQNSMDDRAIEIANLKDRMRDSESDEIKTKLKDSIDKKESKNKEDNNKIKDIQKNIKDLENNLKEKITKKENDIKSWISKL